MCSLFFFSQPISLQAMVLSIVSKSKIELPIRHPSGEAVGCMRWSPIEIYMWGSSDIQLWCWVSSQRSECG